MPHLVRYPWDRWFRQRKFRLTRGREYRGMTHAMSVQVRSAAIKRGLRASVRVEEDSLVITLRGDK
jgi:hypothetical protein